MTPLLYPYTGQDTAADWHPVNYDGNAWLSDAATTWTIAAAKDDVLDILHNDWPADESQCIEAEAEVDAAELYATVGAW